MYFDYLDTARAMLRVETLPAELVLRLERINDLCETAGGRLSSRQIVAKEIMDWEGDH